jgi:hypothetical protein
VEIRSALGVNVKVSLTVASSSDTVTVEAGSDLVENDPIGHTDVDRGLFDKIPLESQSSSVSSLVTLTAPGVAADSNGLFHGLGDHASNSFSVDNQPITGQEYGAAQEGRENLLLTQEERACRDEESVAHAPQVPSDAPPA